MTQVGKAVMLLVIDLSADHHMLLANCIIITCSPLVDGFPIQLIRLEEGNHIRAYIWGVSIESDTGKMLPLHLESPVIDDLNHIRMASCFSSHAGVLVPLILGLGTGSVLEKQFHNLCKAILSRDDEWCFFCPLVPLIATPFATSNLAA